MINKFKRSYYLLFYILWLRNVKGKNVIELRLLTILIPGSRNFNITHELSVLNNFIGKHLIPCFIFIRQVYSKWKVSVLHFPSLFFLINKYLMHILN